MILNDRNIGPYDFVIIFYYDGLKKNRSKFIKKIYISLIVLDCHKLFLKKLILKKFKNDKSS